MSPLPESFAALRGWASAPDFVGRALAASYASGPRRYLQAFATVVALELVVALPFVVVDPADVRGVPGPLLIVISLGGCFLLGLRAGVPLVVLAVVLGITIVHESEIASPLVWIPAAVLVGWLGDETRRGEALRRSLVTELHAGLIALSREPEVGPLRVVTRYLPAQQEQLLAGDFYGVLPRGNGGVAAMVGDVSGHGPEAAATATHLRAAWRALAAAGASPVRTVRVLNDSLLAEQSGSGPLRFATLCMAWFEPDLDWVSIISAGHPPPLLIRRDGAHSVALQSDPPIGILQQHEWQEQQIELPGGAWSLMFYTDGLIEGRSQPDGPRPFGLERLCAAAARLDVPLGEADIDRLVAEVHEANGGAMLDDIVIVSMAPVAAVTS